ncbi:MFS transporter [Kitasatospora sp. NPDC050543]|uniref:MFS transporter n=1 Tax=Kitasatospora sp. NPDC050543 TaxID=3364054 RepID=UPI0037B018F3
MQKNRPGALWALLATSIPMFMVSLDNLVVTNALTEMSADFHVGQAELQWVVNGYVLAFAGLLLAGAALGDRFGRRRIFVWGILLFTLGSAACGLADSAGQLVAARVLQGAGAAAILPVSLTLAVAAVPPARRALAVGVWGGVNGLGVAVGPLAGGLVTEGLDWHWIFWINVPVGLAALPLALWAIRESRGRAAALDVTGILLATSAVVSAVWGIVGAADHGWGGARTLGGLAAAGLLLTVFAVHERRVPEPLVPLAMYRIRPFMLSNAVSLAMYFGVFGSIFFLAQFMQGPMGYTPFGAGLRTLPWTAAPMIVVPIASALVPRVGGGILQALGCAMQAAALGWIALLIGPDVSYPALVPALALAGVGMGLVFAAVPATVIGSVAEHEHNKASGVNNTVREFGGALGIAVLTTVFTHAFDAGLSHGPRSAFEDGLRQSLWLGVAVVLAGALAALFIRRPGRAVRIAAPTAAAVPRVAEPKVLAAADPD